MEQTVYSTFGNFVSFFVCIAAANVEPQYTLKLLISTEGAATSISNFLTGDQFHITVTIHSLEICEQLLVGQMLKG